MRVMLHALEANIHAEGSVTSGTQETLNVSRLVVSDAEPSKVRRMTEYAGSDINGFNDDMLTHFLA